MLDEYIKIKLPRFTIKATRDIIEVDHFGRKKVRIKGTKRTRTKAKDLIIKKTTTHGSVFAVLRMLTKKSENTEIVKACKQILYELEQIKSEINGIQKIKKYDLNDWFIIDGYFGNFSVNCFGWRENKEQEITWQYLQTQYFPSLKVAFEHLVSWMVVINDESITSIGQLIDSIYKNMEQLLINYKEIPNE